MKQERDRLDAENLKLHERNGDLNLEVENLKSELEQVRAENASLKSTASDSGLQQTQSKNELLEMRDLVLASLKLGKQAPGYKAAKQALDKFVEALK